MSSPCAGSIDPALLAMQNEEWSAWTSLVSLLCAAGVDVNDKKHFALVRRIELWGELLGKLRKMQPNINSDHLIESINHRLEDHHAAMNLYRRPAGGGEEGSMGVLPPIEPKMKEFGVVPFISQVSIGPATPPVFSATIEGGR